MNRILMNKMLIIIIALFSIQVYGQLEDRITVREIKLSRLYFYGEGVRDSLVNAKADALSDLQYKMSVTLNSESNLTTQENDKEITQDYSKSINMTSIIKLKGIEYFEQTMVSGKIKVIAYISKESFNSLQAELKNTITDLINTAEKKEIEKGISSALAQYYEAYLQTFLTPNTIPFSSKTFNEDFSNARVFLEAKLKSFLAGISLKTKEISPDRVAHDFFEVNMEATYKNFPVSNIDVSFDLPENPIQEMKNGKTTLFLYSQPSNIREEYRVILKIPYNKNNELQSVHKLFAFTEKQIVELNFTDIVKIDFKTKTRKKNYVTIIPIIENLSVSSLLWELDNGIISSDNELLVNLDFSDEREISLIINNEKDLTETKLLTKNGKLIDSNSKNIANEVDVEKKISEKVPVVIEDLIKYKTYDTIIERLVKYKNEGKVIYGKAASFQNIETCYGIVINPSDRKVLSLFSPGKTLRKDLFNNTTIDDYRKKFKGNAIIWMQLN